MSSEHRDAQDVAMQNADNISATADFLREILDSGDSCVLLDSGGFAWWTHEDREGRWFAGVGTPARPGETGTAIDAWLNVMTPGNAANFGPFTIIYRSNVSAFG